MIGIQALRPYKNGKNPETFNLFYSQWHHHLVRKEGSERKRVHLTQGIE